MRGLIIFTPDFYPSELVASRRITYWAKNLKEYSPHLTSVTIITSNPTAKAVSGVNELIILKGKNSTISKFIQIIKLARIVNSFATPQNVLITAGPFYFLLSSLLMHKKHHIIFDLRDPYASDPFANASSLKLFLKRKFQNWIMKRPGAIVTINEFLKEDFAIPSNIPTYIVPNGIETDQFKVNFCRNKKVLVLGKVYGRIDSTINKILNSDPEIEIHQYTDLNTTPSSHRLPTMDRVYVHDRVSKEVITDLCSQFEFGLVASYPKEYVLPVKIFDYICNGLKLIVFNDSSSDDTEIKRLLSKYPAKFYCTEYNFNKEKFAKLLTFSSDKAIDPEIISTLYFRKFSLKNLIKSFR